MLLSSASSHPLTSLPDECFFPDRTEECARIGRFLESSNHLILTGPKGSGKTSLVLTAVRATGHPFVYVDVSQALSVTDLAALLLQSFLSLFAPERFRGLVAGFRAWPSITYDAETNAFDVSFPASANPDAVLEDVLSILEKKCDPERRLVVILDEYSAGDTLEEAHANAKESAELWLEAVIEDGGSVPQPSAPEALQEAHPEWADWLWSAVEVDVPSKPDRID